jgi:3-methyladenine DNA glycosylase AlkD
MPTVLRIGPYRFFFYAGDRDEPPHVHVERDDFQAKFWLAPVRFQTNKGFRKKDLRKIADLIEQNQEELMGRWDEYFNE